MTCAILVSKPLIIINGCYPHRDNVMRRKVMIFVLQVENRNKTDHAIWGQTTSKTQVSLLSTRCLFTGIVHLPLAIDTIHKGLRGEPWSQGGM